MLANSEKKTVNYYFEIPYILFFLLILSGIVSVNGVISKKSKYIIIILKVLTNLKIIQRGMK